MIKAPSIIVPENLGVNGKSKESNGSDERKYLCWKERIQAGLDMFSKDISATSKQSNNNKGNLKESERLKERA